MGYDVFISYSRTADRALAEVLQRGLERIGRRWFRLKALRVFRDESDLLPGPDLWARLDSTLENSRFIVLLACAESASSVGVRHEVEYWLKSKKSETLLIALTGGALTWDASANGFLPPVPLPPELVATLRSEPLYVDLRWAREAQKISIKHPRIFSAVAELAAPVHGVSRAEILGEERRQQRRLTAAFGTLAAIALLGATFAFVQRNAAQREQQRAEQQTEAARIASQKAREQARIARENEESARVQRELADRRRKEADDQRTEAEKQREHALAEAFVRAAQNRVQNMPSDLMRAGVLAAETLSREPSVDAARILQRAVETLLQPAGGLSTTGTTIALARGLGSSVVIGTDAGQVLGWDTTRGKVLFRIPKSRQLSGLWSAGSLLVVARSDGYTRDRPGRFWASGPIEVYSMPNIEPVATLESKNGFSHVRVDPKAGGFVAASGFASASENELIGWDLATRAEIWRYQHAGAISNLQFDPNGDVIVASDYARTVVERRWPTGELVTEIPHPGPVQSVTFSKDGCCLVTAIGRHDSAVAFRPSQNGARLEPTAFENDEARGIRTFTAEGKLLRYVPLAQHARNVQVSLQARVITADLNYPHSGLWWATSPSEKAVERFGLGSGMTEDGRFAMLWQEDGTGSIIDVEAGTEKRIKLDSNGRGLRLVRATDGRQVLISSQNSTIAVWNAHHGREVAFVSLPEDNDPASASRSWIGAQGEDVFLAVKGVLSRWRPSKRQQDARGGCSGGGTLGIWERDNVICARLDGTVVIHPAKGQVTKVEPKEDIVALRRTRANTIHLLVGAPARLQAPSDGDDPRPMRLHFLQAPTLRARSDGLLSGRTIAIDLTKGSAEDRIRFEGQHNDLALSPDGNRFVVAAKTGVAVYSAATQQLERWLIEKSVASFVEFSHHGKYVGAQLSNENLRVGVWRTDNWQRVLDEKKISEFVFSGDETTMAAWGVDGTVSVFNLSTGKTTATLPTGDVDRAAIHENILALVSKGSVQVWDVGSSRQLLSVPHEQGYPARVLDLDLAAEPKTLRMLYEDGTIRRIVWNAEQLIAEFCKNLRDTRERPSEWARIAPPGATPVCERLSSP